MFLQHYFRHVDAIDVDERSVENLLGLVESHYRAAMHRPAARAVISIRTPSQTMTVGPPGGATVVQIVTDDSALPRRLGHHGGVAPGMEHSRGVPSQFLVRRDLEGTCCAHRPHQGG